MLPCLYSFFTLLDREDEPVAYNNDRTGCRSIAGIVANFLVESVDAWHAEFSSEKECRNAVNEATGNKAGEANRICERLIPHDD